MEYSTADGVGKSSSSAGDPPVSPITPTKKLQSVVSYQVFVLEQKSKLSGKYPFLKAHQINGKLRKMWESLPLAEKSNYRKCTLLSVPTPQKKTTQEGKKKKCKGRLLTPKSHQGRLPILESHQGRQPCKEWGNICSGKEDSLATVKTDIQLEKEHVEFDSNDTDKPEEEEIGLASHESLWSSTGRTYINTRYRVKYPIPKVIQEKGTGSLDQPGILKSAKKENKRRASRVSFSAEDVQVKIMSQSEKEDSVSADSFSPVENNVKPMYSPQFCNKSAFPSQASSPYDFDAIDQYEMCLDTPEKGNVTRRTRSRSSPSLSARHPGSEITEKPKKCVQLKGKEKTKPRQLKKKTRSPILEPGRHRMSSKSSSVCASISPKNSLDSVEFGEIPPPPGYMFHFTELSSSPDPLDTENYLGRGDAEDSFHDLDHVQTKSDFFSNVGAVTGKDYGNLYADGDHAQTMNQSSVWELVTPPTVEGRKTIEDVLAPRKRKQLSYVKKGNKSPKMRPVTKMKSTVSKRQKQTKLMAETDIHVSGQRMGACIDENNGSQLLSGSCKKKRISENRFVNRGNTENAGKTNGKLETATEKTDDVASYFDSEHAFQCGNNFNCYFRPKSVCSAESVLKDENSSSPDIGMSPLLLQTKSRLTVAETVRSMKLIASPDHCDSPSMSTCINLSTVSPKILSPTLSDISLLSSVSSCSSMTAVRKADQMKVAAGGSFSKDKAIIPQRMVKNGRTSPHEEVRSTSKRESTQKNLAPKTAAKQRSLPDMLGRTLCEMFQDSTPPEERVSRKSTRRMVSSAGDEGSSNFSNLFEEQDIFG